MWRFPHIAIKLVFYKTIMYKNDYVYIFQSNNNGVIKRYPSRNRSISYIRDVWLIFVIITFCRNFLT